MSNRPPDAILDAAFRTFTERGYRAARLDDVADAVGATKGAIYYYFDSKEDLLRQAVEARHRTIYAEIGQALAAQSGPVSASIRLVLRRLWEHVVDADWGPAFRLMLGEMSVDFPALFRTWAEAGPLQWTTLVADLIEEGVDRGEFRPDTDAEVSARVVVSGLMLQAALHVHLGLDQLAPMAPDRIFDSSVDLLLHGLAVAHHRPDTPTS